MGKKISKKEKKEIVESVLKEQKKLLKKIMGLKDFCLDNILALEPLLHAEHDTSAVEERMLRFEELLDILDIFSAVAADEIPEEVIVGHCK